MFSSGTGCKGFTPINPKTIDKLKSLGIQSSYSASDNQTIGPIFANYDIASITPDKDPAIFKATYADKKEGIDTFKVSKGTNPCTPTKTKDIKAGEEVFPSGCILTSKK